jgi:hypothetical protein
MLIALFCLTLFSTGYTQSIDRAKLDLLFYRAPDKFTIGPGITVTFDAAKEQMTIKRPQGERVFTKEN